MTSWPESILPSGNQKRFWRDPVKRIGAVSGCQTWKSRRFEISFAVRRTISNATWAEIRTAYASGIGLREIARNMGIPEGTVLARAKREGWTRRDSKRKGTRKARGCFGCCHSGSSGRGHDAADAASVT